MPFEDPPDPESAHTIDALIERLRLLKIWAGNPSYEWIKDQINAAWQAAGRPAAERPGKTTIVDCFRSGRRRLNPDLVIAVVQTLHPDPGYVTRWRQSLRVIGGQHEAATRVQVQDTLPQDLDGFTGRSAELDRLCRRGHHGGAVVIAGMAGVGKTNIVKMYTGIAGRIRSCRPPRTRQQPRRAGVGTSQPSGQLTGRLARDKGGTIKES